MSVPRHKNPISYNEIKKRAALKCNKCPRVTQIKQTLGVHLGSKVVDSIPKYCLKVLSLESDEAKEYKKTEQLIKVYIDDSPETQNLQIIMRIGAHLKIRKEQDINAWEDKLINAFVRQIDAWTETLDEKLEAEFVHSMRVEEEGFQKDKIEIADNFDKLFIIVADQIETAAMTECERILEIETAKAKRKQAKMIGRALAERENKMKNEFLYHMTLVRNDLYVEFQNERCELELRWVNATKARRERNRRDLAHLRASLEAEHVQKLTELDLDHEKMLIREKAVEADRRTRVVAVVPVDRISLLTTRLREIDDELLIKDRELFVYEKRLKYVLNGYIDYLENGCQNHHPAAVIKKQLVQSKLLMEKLYPTAVDDNNNEHRETITTPCAINKTS